MTKEHIPEETIAKCPRCQMYPDNWVADEVVLMFIGWLCGELPELHQIEVPRVKAAWDKFLDLYENGGPHAQ